jgi:hypothetical protein
VIAGDNVFATLHHEQANEALITAFMGTDCDDVGSRRNADMNRAAGT